MKGKMCFLPAARAIYLEKDNKWFEDASPHPRLLFGGYWSLTLTLILLREGNGTPL